MVGIVLAAAISAESGTSRPGVVSRWAAIASRVVHSSRTAARARRPLALWIPDVRRHGSCRGRRHVVDEVLELLLGPLVLAGLDQRRGDHVAQLDQHLDVEGGVLQPGLRQRSPWTSRRRSAPCASSGPGSPRRAWPGRRAGSPAAGRRARCRRAAPAQPDLAQARQVLAGRVQDPLGVADRVVQRRQVGEADRVDQRRARALAAQLDQVGARGVAVAGGTLGVQRDRAAAGGDPGRPRRPARRRSR